MRDKTKPLRWSVFLSVALCSLVMHARAYGQTLACEPPMVEVSLAYKPAEVKNHVSTKTMTKHANSKHPTVGLYRANQRVYVRMVRAESKYTQEICIRNVYITYSINHVIDIGLEHQPGTCSFEETLKHERRHEAIHIEKAKEAEAIVLREFSKRPLYFSGPAYQEDTKEWLGKSVDWASSVYRAFIIPAQEAFDSPEEYRRFSLLCSADLIAKGVLQR